MSGPGKSARPQRCSFHRHRCEQHKPRRCAAGREACCPRHKGVIHFSPEHSLSIFSQNPPQPRWVAVALTQGTQPVGPGWAWDFQRGARDQKPKKGAWACPLCSLSIFFLLLSSCSVLPTPNPQPPVPLQPPNPDASGFPQHQSFSGAEVREGMAFPILFVLVQWPGLIFLLS